ncbi:MAG: methyl-accepting chemotaxis protein [Phycisphaerales bacterium]|nr:methyl-accepting chemotaxis protein [Phycisphaerales bacterium]
MPILTGVPVVGDLQMRIRYADWKLATKLIVLSLMIVVGTVASLGYVAVKRSTTIINTQQRTRLEAIAYARAHEIKSYVEFVENQLRSFAGDIKIGAATRAFSDAFASVVDDAGIDAAQMESMTRNVKGYYDNEFRPRLDDAGQPYRGAATYVPAAPQAKVLQAMYIAENPNPVGSKLNLTRAAAECTYNDLHATYHPDIKTFLENFGYYDIFLFDLEGNLVYSVFKETDYATNFLNGPYRDTNFGDVYRKALASNSSGEVFLEDFRAYEPSYGAAAFFVGAPVFDQGEKVGVAIFQVPVDYLDTIMTDPHGMGETGEVFLIGADKTMRSNSRFLENTILNQVVDSRASERVLKGETGAELQTSYLGEPVLASFQPLGFDGLDWGVIAEVSQAEVFAPARKLRTQVAIIGGVIGLVSIFGAWIFVRNLVRPIHKIVEGTAEVSKGNLTIRLEEGRGDELGDLARATNRLTASLASMISDIKDASSQVAAASTQIAASAEEMAVGLKTQEGQTQDIARSIDELHSTVGDVANQSTTASNAVDESGKEAQEGGNVVRSTIEQIEGIAAQVNESAQAVTALGHKGNQIGEIIQVINDIAEQTNLLALNAAIEAARAGEHGRGFAVVADEVRKLAERTTQATDEVAKSIREIQEETGRAVSQIEAGTERVGRGVELANSAGEALERIMKSSSRVREMVSAIATAADQQAHASQQISRSMESIACVTRESNEGASQAAAAAMELSEQAENLNTIVSRFQV